MLWRTGPLESRILPSLSDEPRHELILQAPMVACSKGHRDKIGQQTTTHFACRPRLGAHPLDLPFCSTNLTSYSSPPTRLIRKQQQLPSQSLSKTSTLPSGPRYPAPNITLKHTSFLPADHARTSDIQECSAWRVRSIFPGPLAPSSHLRGRDKSVKTSEVERFEADFLFRLRLGARLALAKGCRPPHDGRWWHPTAFVYI